jgi:predicted GNAT family N-acyltransferase
MAEIHIIKAQEDAEFEAVYAIRRTVFVEEQKVPEMEEFDGYEAISHHYLALMDHKPIGCARWRITPYMTLKLERFAVLEPYRNLGVGAAILKTILNEIPSGYPVYLHAQLHAVPFYQKYGFLSEGEMFMECDIPHYKMRLIKDNA